MYLYHPFTSPGWVNARRTLIAGAGSRAFVSRLTWNYVLALSVVAGLFIGSSVILDHALQKNAGSAGYVNFTGRQRMLSQRIASLAAQYRLGDDSAARPLAAALDELAANDDIQTRQAIATRNVDPISVELYHLYAEQPGGVDAQVKHYVADVRLLRALPAASPAAAPILARIFAASRGPLINVLEQAVILRQLESQHLVESSRILDAELLALLLAALAAEAMFIFRPLIRTIDLSMAEIVRLATVDPLSGLMNRRGFVERFNTEQARARRYRRPLSLLMLDVDHFKHINDTHGHEGGDEVLKRLSATLNAMIRITDVAARIGGEEFALLMAETNLQGAAILAERLRATIAAESLDYAGRKIAFTVSIGVVQVPGAIHDISQALNLADRLMYDAKARGRNLVVCQS